MANVYKAKIDIKKSPTSFKPAFVQYDHAELEIELLDNNKPYDLSTTDRVEFTHVRKDGLVIIQPGEIVKKNNGTYIRYEYLGNEMDLIGTIKTSFAIFNAERKRVSSPTFDVRITKDLREEIFSPAEPNGSIVKKIFEEVDYISSKRTQIDFLIENFEELLPPIFNEAGATFIIRNQTDCNNLSNAMRNVDAQIINVAFSGGKYFVDQVSLNSSFDNKTINFYNVSGEKVEIFPASDIYLPSDAVEATPTHYICNLKSPYLGNDSLITNNGRTSICDSRVIATNGVHYNAQNHVETVDPIGKVYRLKLPNDLLFLEGETIQTNSRLYLWAGWLMHGNSIIKIENGYVYFSNTFSNRPNQDWDTTGRSARFYITNNENFLTDDTFMVKNGKVYIPKTCKYAIMAKKTTCFEFRDMSPTQITFNNITFSGGYYDFNRQAASTIDIYNVENIEIKKCDFINLDSQVIVINGTGNGSTIPLINKNIEITKCTFENLGSGAIEFFGEDVSVTHCSFKHFGQIRMGCTGVRPSGLNFDVSDNTFYEFPYGGINVGRTRNEEDYNTGVIKRNILHCDPKRNRAYDMADGGAIYAFTHNEDLLIEDNVIFNIFGHDMRGIMGDDGNNNTRYIRNLVFNIFGEMNNNGIIAINTWATSTKNHWNNLFKNNIVFGNRIAYGTADNYTTKEDTNVITHSRYAANGFNVVINPNITVKDYRIEENFIVLSEDFVFPFEIPEIFEPYIKYEEMALNVKNRGRKPILLNNTDAELNIGNQVVSSTSQMYKYDQLSMNLHMVRGFHNSWMGQFSSLKIQLPWKLGVMTGGCFINFKVNIFSERAIYRNTFEVTMNTHKADAATYGNLAFDVSRVSPKTNSTEAQLKLTAYLDAQGFFSLLIEPLITGEPFISSTLFYLELCDVKVYKHNDLTGEKGVISINQTIPANATKFGTYAVLSTRATKAHLQQAGISYPDSQVVYLTDTNQIAIRKNGKWYVQGATELT